MLLSVYDLYCTSYIKIQAVTSLEVESKDFVYTAFICYMWLGGLILCEMALDISVFRGDTRRVRR